MIGRNWIIVWAALVLLPLAACDAPLDSGDEEADAKVQDGDKGQVVATVNGEEITVHQLNVELAQLGEVDDPIETRRVALRAIVYRTALRQAALKDQLDRQPMTMVQLQAARDKVLAETYLRSQTASTPPPTVSAIDDYMLRNPLVFDRRRLYDLQRLVMASEDYDEAEMVPLFDEQENFSELEAHLSQNGIGYQTDEIRLPSSQFPNEARERLLNLSQNDNLIIRSEDNVAIMKILNWEEAPLPRGRGRELAQGLLYQQAVQKRAETTKENILANAKIVFQGEFEGLKMEDGSGGLGEAATPPDGAGADPDETIAPSGADSNGTSEGR